LGVKLGTALRIPAAEDTAASS